MQEEPNKICFERYCPLLRLPPFKQQYEEPFEIFQIREDLVGNAEKAKSLTNSSHFITPATAMGNTPFVADEVK